MQTVRTHAGRAARYAWVKGAAILALVVLAGGAVGCQDQQRMTEQNAALNQQLSEALADKAAMEGRLDDMESQNQALRSELDRARATPAPKVQTTPSGKAKPDFGEGTEVKIEGETMKVTLSDEILFTSGSAELKGNSKKVLDKVAAVLNSDYKHHRIRVEGHTDNQPIRKSAKKWQDNWDLSCNRAMAVLRYLVQRGVAPDRVYAAGYSFYRPVASNGSNSGRTKNRRVEIVVWPK